MEELFREEKVKTDEQNGEILTPELLDVVADVIMESKKSGCIKSSVFPYHLTNSFQKLWFLIIIQNSTIYPNTS